MIKIKPPETVRFKAFQPDPVTPFQSAPREWKAPVTPLQRMLANAVRQRRHRERLKANAAKTLAETVAADG